MFKYCWPLFIIIIIVCALYLWANKCHRSGFTDSTRSAYLTELINHDYIQSYPWMASNPGGATSYNKALFQQHSSNPGIYERIPLSYYDFGEITYIGNPL